MKNSAVRFLLVFGAKKREIFDFDIIQKRVSTMHKIQVKSAMYKYRPTRHMAWNCQNSG